MKVYELATKVRSDVGYRIDEDISKDYIEFRTKYRGTDTWIKDVDFFLVEKVDNITIIHMVLGEDMEDGK